MNRPRTTQGPVLLIFSTDGNKKLSINSLPPIGILSIASFLEEKGIHTDIIDFSINPNAEISPETYQILGFSLNVSNVQNSLQLIAEIKRGNPHKHIVVGGPACMSDAEHILQTGLADAVFTCEGEEALFEYINAENKENVKGIYLKRNSEYLYTGNRYWIQNLDQLPFPAFDKVELSKYNNFPKRNRPISSIMTSRGCPFSCIFCSHAMGRKWRQRSPENVVREIKWQVQQFGVREICVYDDNFALDKSRAEKICDLLIEEKVPVTLQFSNGLRVDSLDQRLLEKLKQAGTWLIGIAPESGNPLVMKRIKKGFDQSQVIKVRKECKEIGIKTFAFFMIGFPFETGEDIEDTIRFAKELDCEMVEFNKVIPYPNTELFDLIVKSGCLLDGLSLATQSYHDGPITTHRVTDLQPNEVREKIRRAYREFYLRPSKMLDLLHTFSIQDLWGLTTYAFRTKNV